MLAVHTASLTLELHTSRLFFKTLLAMASNIGPLIDKEIKKKMTQKIR